MAPTPGLRAELTHEVEDADTARALGSGSVDVLGTPRVVALLEAATVQAVDASLEPGATTVGTRVDVEHLAPTPVGATVHASAEVTAVEGRSVTFAVSLFGPALRSEHELLARGTVHRAVVDAERFSRR